jgi:hypothetical protein
MILTGLVVAGVAVYKNWDTIKEKAAQLWNFLRPLFETGINFLINLFNIFTFQYREGLALLLEGAKKVANVFDKDLAQGIQTAIDALRNGVPEVKLAEAGINKLGAEAKVAGQETQVLASETQVLASETQQAEQSFNAIQPEIAGTATEFDGLTSSVNEASDELNTHQKILDQIYDAQRLQVDAGRAVRLEHKQGMEQLQALNGVLGGQYAPVLEKVRNGTISVDQATEFLSEQLKLLEGDLQDTQRGIQSATESWDDYNFKVSDVGRFLEEHRDTTQQVLQALSREWGITILQVQQRLSGMQIAVGDTEDMIKLLSDNGQGYFVDLVLGAAQAEAGMGSLSSQSSDAFSSFSSGSNSANGSFQGFTGGVVTGTQNILNSLSNLNSGFSSAIRSAERMNEVMNAANVAMGAAAKTRADFEKGGRNNELDERGRIGAQIRTAQEGLNQLRNNYSRELSGSGNPEAVKKQFDEREKALRSELNRLTASMPKLDAGGVIQGPGMFSVGAGVKEIWRGQPPAATKTQTIIIELDGHELARSVMPVGVEMIRVKTGVRT